MYPVRVHVQLFGVFRKYSQGAEVIFDVPRGSPVSALRKSLAHALHKTCPTFGDDGLLEVSVLADDHHVLDDEEQVGSGLDQVSIAVLPPVCGG